jgi:formylglycine-generating enzyme required for sulfatase activity
MLPIPADKDGKIKPFWISKTEVTWDAFDVYAFRLDEGESGGANVDAVSRPTKPYLPPDRGLGHEGYAAISVGYTNAQEFCNWLSARTGKHYRLPTEQEWEYACRAGSTKTYGVCDDVAGLKDYAWYADDSDGAPHPVAQKKPNAWGLYDMQGNVLEWVQGADGKPTTCGGSWRDEPEKLKPESRQKQEPSWNVTDPQIPKSKWWLSDGPMVGFRIVCDPDSAKKDGDKH